MFKEKEIIELLKSIDNKLNQILVLEKSKKIKSICKDMKGGKQ